MNIKQINKSIRYSKTQRMERVSQFLFWRTISYFLACKILLHTTMRFWHDSKLSVLILTLLIYFLWHLFLMGSISQSEQELFLHVVATLLYIVCMNTHAVKIYLSSYIFSSNYNSKLFNLFVAFQNAIWNSVHFRALNNHNTCLCIYCSFRIK